MMREVSLFMIAVAAFVVSITSAFVVTTSENFRASRLHAEPVVATYIDSFGILRLQSKGHHVMPKPHAKANNVLQRHGTSVASVNVPESRLELLDAALRSHSTAATTILNELNELRPNQAKMEAYVGALLDEIDTPTPWWTNVKPVVRVSRRARLASLRRVLDLSTPPPSEGDESSDKDADKRRRRRALVVILRSLASINKEEDESAESDVNLIKVKSSETLPAILVLEKTARKEAKSAVDPSDMASRLPQGLETPTYKVLAGRKGYEVRRYEPFSVCSVEMNRARPANASATDAKISQPQLAGASSFGALAGYLFGKNQESTAMKMTTPVLSTGEGSSRRMSFVLPSDYWNGIEMAPKPLDGSGVVLTRDDGGNRAVLMFGGYAGKKDVEERTQQLLRGLAHDQDWNVDPSDVSSVSLAQYNDPFTPPWKRRNEVSVKVLAREN